MPPGWFFIGLGFVCRFTWFTPLTITCVSSTTLATSPRLPLSRPAMTTTLSPFLILRMCSLFELEAASEDFRRQRDDLHEPLGAQLARDRSEDAGADRLELVVEQHGGVRVEANERAVIAANALAGAHDDGAVDLALLDTTTRRGFLHRNLDDVADVRVAALAAAQHLDAHHGARARVVGDVEYRLHLNHDSVLSNLIRLRCRFNRLPADRLKRKGGGQFWTPSRMRNHASGWDGPRRPRI